MRGANPFSCQIAIFDLSTRASPEGVPWPPDGHLSCWFQFQVAGIGRCTYLLYDLDSSFVKHKSTHWDFMPS